jgi:serine protease AprX
MDIGCITRRSGFAALAVAVILPLAVPATTAAATAAATATSPRAQVRSQDGATLPLGSMYHVVDQIGARELWERGVDGTGVTVAVVDTGVAPVAALADQVVATVDLSGEARVPEARFVDTYGHGSHMAGIIAGRSPGADPATADDHPDWFLGVAPGADLVSVKVGDNTGATDISQVIAGVDWVVDHADELDIDVLNLSYDSGSPLPYLTDPLVAAVERAWLSGIVVVVAGGNDGRRTGVLGSPALDPYVVSVAAAQAQPRGRFTVPSWTSTGSKSRPPDLVAPGTSIDSLRVPNSRVDLEHPEGFVSDTLFRGSGSSQAAAVVAGAAALLLEERPWLTPDQVKNLLVSTADNRIVTPRHERISGAGMLRVDVASERVAGVSVQTWPLSDGSGSLDAARGGDTITIDGVVVTGDRTVLGVPYVGARWEGSRWSEGSWDGSRWSAATWLGSRWSDATWTGSRWTGSRWSIDDWAGSGWSGSRWSGSRWSADAWSGSRWSGSRWSGSRWSGSRWSGSRWSVSTWT